MTEDNNEVMDIAQEECAEVIQAVSKCYRFGLDNSHKSGLTQRANLEMEVGDMLALVDILVEQGILDQDGLELAMDNKKEKLKIWSKLYET